MELKITGFKKEASSLLILIVKNNGSATVERNYNDFRKLSRSVNKLKDNDEKIVRCSGMPVESFKKLCGGNSWKVNGDGWQPQLTKSVFSLEQWLGSVSASNLPVMNHFIDEEQYSKERECLSQRKLEEARPRMLQQYFASEININTIVQLAFSNMPNTEYLTFVEPSCGDGRVLQALLKTGARSVVGCDIDSVVAQRAVAATRLLCTGSQTCDVFVQDFLTTTRQSFLSDSTGADSVSKSHRLNNGIVVVGGPPYSIVGKSRPASSSSGSVSSVNHNSFLSQTGSDLSEMHSSDEQEPGGFDYSGSNRDDYPLLFLVHCATVLCAQRIVFILPDRCGSDAFVRRATQLMNSFSRAENSNDNTSGEDNDLNTSENSTLDAMSWHLTSSVTGDNCFDLLGKVIRQPAIIQQWDFSRALLPDTSTIV